jgi:hypothetical protein
MNTSNRKMSTATVARVTKAAGKGREYAGAKVLAVDGMYADGVLPSDCYSPTKKNLESGKSTATAEGYAALNDAIVAGFTTAQQDLLAPASSRGMTESQKIRRRMAQQQIGAIRNDLKSALQRRQTSGGANKTRTATERVVANLDKVEKIVEDSTVEFDVENFNNAMKLVRDVVETGLSE